MATPINPTSSSSIAFTVGRPRRQVLVGHFDAAQVRAPGERISPASLVGGSGPLLHLPPEAFSPETVDGPALDCWGLGVMLFSLLHGRHPFVGTTLVDAAAVAPKIAMSNIKAQAGAAPVDGGFGQVRLETRPALSRPGPLTAHPRPGDALRAASSAGGGPGGARRCLSGAAADTG